MLRSIVIHGHFYQPPREDPWLEEIEKEASAAPYHDWNERIERECYRTVVAARIPDAAGRIRRIVNTLEWLSFNFGPTLLEWLERAAPETYAAVLEADRRSLARNGGHGNAIAMPYHHAILPLSSRADATTEVRWGMADFRRRFGRDPEGMWLPETAVDHDTLELLAAEGVGFSILAPHQVENPPPDGLPGWYRTHGGRRIALFIYDGPISHDVAFGPLIRDAEAWARRLLAPDTSGVEPRLVSLATDGETFGHHHKFGEMALARTLEILNQHPGVRVENFAAFLARQPPVQELELVSPSSWSCAHGIERWRSDCGCRIAPERHTNQRWRTPLREAVTWLGGELHGLFLREAGKYFENPLAVRDAYGAVVGAEAEAARQFVVRHMRDPADPRARVRAGELLELERDALRLFTSCAWFFDDLGGLEPRQVLRYAARAIELAAAEGPRLEATLLKYLARAESNDPAVGRGSDVYLQRAKPVIPADVRIAAGVGVVPAITGSAAFTAECHRQGDRADVALTHRRTGKRSEFHTHAEPHGPRDYRFEVCRVGDTARHELTLRDLLEAHRQAMLQRECEARTARTLSEPERALLASGTRDLGSLAALALARALTDLSRQNSEPVVQPALEAVGLLEFLGVALPFDAQTTFARIWFASTPAQAEALRPLAQSLGFSVSPEP